MSFDKTKAMRNAERFLSQGKYNSAISEYQKVVELDPKDFATMNILGDLYAKASDIERAVNCFKQVADHYNKQGFAQKAIAIYNKVSRLDPNSMEILEKLAQLYQSRGSNAEARNHYAQLADRLQKKGKKAEALEVWKQIAKLDPNNTEVYLKVAEFCIQNGQKDEATKAYTEAGIRLAAADQAESALTAFSRALEIRQYDLAALNGYVKAQIKLGYAEDATVRLEKILEQSPYNREILYLLVDCHLESGNLSEAENAVIRLVEQEPANYPKFVELVEHYIKYGDLVSAARVLSMSSEHLLVGGRHEEFRRWVNEIIQRDGDQLDALRLLVRYFTWQRDETELRRSLERLAEAARIHNETEDEKYALTQLVLIAPHEIEFARRLQEIKIEQGDFSPIEIPEPEPVQAIRQPAPEFGSFEFMDDSVAVQPSGDSLIFADESPFDAEQVFGSNTVAGQQFATEPDAVEAVPIPFTGADVAAEFGFNEPASTGSAAPEIRELSPAEEMRVSQETESIDFYIAQGYLELADRSIAVLENEFGNRPEFDALRARLVSPAEADVPVSFDPEVPASVVPDAGVDQPVAAASVIEAPAETRSAVPPIVSTPSAFTSNGSGDFLDEFRAELGLEDPKPAIDDDFETVFNTAIVYKEMGLLEDSIRGFQDAVNRVRPDDGTRRFFNCCNMLGHCFMEKGMPNLAIIWFKRSLETPGLSFEENHAVLYELGSLYAAAGDHSKAVECFEQICAVNIAYRDVSTWLTALSVPSPA